jgi:hypothetical protein
MARADDKPLTPEQAREKLRKGLMDYLAGNNPGPIVFRLRPTKKPGETYPLKLTQQQRQTLIQHTNLRGRLKKKIKEAGNGTQVVGVTGYELETLHDEVGEALAYARSRDRRRLQAVQDRVRKLFDEEEAQLFGSATPKVRKRRLVKSKLPYQFRITLLGVHPAIWRRIQVRDCTLAYLHRYIQASFGWWDYHLHQFEIEGVKYGQPAPNGDDLDMVCEDESQVLVSELVPRSGERMRWTYEYDFGDDWRHEVLFEGCPPIESAATYPRCLEGDRACPPEDCGGPGGFREYLAAIRDPDHEEHEEMLKWRGPFNPGAFDAQEATSAMRKLKP